MLLSDKSNVLIGFFKIRLPSIISFPNKDNFSRDEKCIKIEGIS